MNSPLIRQTIKNEFSAHPSLINSTKIYEIIEKKNYEIQQSLIKERQSMSEVVYNYSRFRSM
jgi:hypothetical protein